MEEDPHQKDIPIWFSGTQRWMTGLTKRTTCDDIIYALLFSSGLHEVESTDNFAIFEKWREVERPLSARTKILKVWTFWGEEQPNVQLSMRSLDDYFLPGESNLYMRSRRRHKKSSRHRSRHATHCKCHNKRGCTECSRLRSLEQLVKLVVSQERKIQDLSDRIYDTDKLIEKHEARIHQHRVQQNGLDYVQNSYLNSCSESSSSADGSTFSNLDLKDLKAIFPHCSLQEVEEIVRMCDSMAHVERRLGQEQAKIKEMAPEVEKLAEKMGVAAQLEGETNAELEDTRVEMIRAVTTHVTNEYNERELERKMEICTRELTARAEYMRELYQELSELDKRLGDDPMDSQTAMSTEDGTYNISVSSHHQHHHPNPAAIYSTQGPVHSNHTEDTASKLKSWSSTALGSTPTNMEHSNPIERGRRGRNSSRERTSGSNVYREHSSERNAYHISHSNTTDRSFGEMSSRVSASPSIVTSVSTSSYSNMHIDSYIPDSVRPTNRTAMANYKSFDNGSGVRHVDKPPISDFSTDHPNSEAVSRPGQGESISGSPFSRESRSMRRARDQQRHRLYTRSRSADRSDNVLRDRSPGPGTMDEISKYGTGNNIRNPQYDDSRFEPRMLHTNSVVNQYGLEVYRGGTRGHNFDKSKGGYPNLVTTSRNSNTTTSYQSPSHLQSQEGVPVRAHTEFKYSGQRQQQQSPGWRYTDVSHADNDTLYARNSNKQIEENSNLRSGGQTSSRDYKQELRTSANTGECGEKAAIQITGLNTTAEPRAEIRGPRSMAGQDGALFEQSISGPAKMWLHNRGSVQKGTTNTLPEASPNLNKLTVLSKDKGVHSVAESQHRQPQGHGVVVGMVGISASSRDPEGYDNRGGAALNGGNNSTLAYSPYNASPSPTSGTQTNDLRPSRQTVDTQIGRQTTVEYASQDGFRNFVTDNKSHDLSNGINTHHTSNQLVLTGSHLAASTYRQQGSPYGQSNGHLGDGTSGHVSRLQVPTDVINRSWSGSDDVFIQEDFPSHAGTSNDVISQPLRNAGSSYDTESRYGDGGSTLFNARDFSHRDGNRLPRRTFNTNAMNVATAHNNFEADPKSSYDANSIPSIQIDSPNDKPSGRGALYHIVSNKMNKSKVDSNSSYSDDGRPSGPDLPSNQSVEPGRPTSGVPSPGATRSTTSHEKLTSQPVNGFKTSVYGLSYDGFGYQNSGDSNIRIMTSQEQNGSNDGRATSQQVTSDKPPASERPGGRRRALNPHFCDVPNGSKANGTLHTKFNDSSNSSSSSNRKNNHVTFQNSLNQTNGFQGRGILKNGDKSSNNHHQNQTYNTPRVDTLNIKDILSNRDAGKDRNDFSRSNRGNGGTRVTIVTNGHGGTGERTKIEDNNDSNSDTGLSSMHSDETANMETLV